MKKIVSGKELEKKMDEAINLLCDTVKSTLGPKGSNVIIDHSSFSPFITNDGVTIASNIESDDEVINTILHLAKEASIKTNSNVGDGTTTTLVLLQKIYEEGRKLINNGLNPIILKKELQKRVEKIIEEIKNKSMIPSDKELLKIACTSSNSLEIGNNIYKAFSMTKNASSIKIEESKNELTKISKKSGYIIDSNVASFYFFKDKEKITIDKPNILLINDTLNDIEEISELVNEVIVRKEKLVIISEDYSDYFIKEVVSLFLDENIEIYLLKWSEFGKRKLDIINDVSLITNSKVCDKNILYNNIGKCKSLEITKEEVIFIYDKANVKDKVLELEKKLKGEADEFEREFLNRRLSMLQDGLVVVEVGGLTKTEQKEKKMRYDDALCALNSALQGVVLGGGVTFYEISEKLVVNDDIDEIFKISLAEVLKQILFNAGALEDEILKEIRKSHFKKVYNVKSGLFEEKDINILDATEVIISALRNAISIASMLLTTTSLIINEYRQEINTNELDI